LRRERRQQRIEGADELLARQAGREPEPGQWGEDELSCLEGQVVERTQLMSEVDLALTEADEQDRRVLARIYGAGLCRESPDEEGEAPVSAVRRKQRLFRARQRLYRRLTARVLCVVRCGDEFARERLLARVPEKPEPGARCAQRVES